jgi:hypothetical protein
MRDGIVGEYLRLNPAGAFLGQTLVFHSQSQKAIGNERLFALGRLIAHLSGTLPPAISVFHKHIPSHQSGPRLPAANDLLGEELDMTIWQKNGGRSGLSP